MEIEYLVLRSIPIQNQLEYEEALLRSSTKNVVIINIKPPPAIVLGISSSLDDAVHTESTKKRNIPIIRRYSGGGTVAVDEGTIFISFIFNTKEANIEPFPDPVHDFSFSIYKDLFYEVDLELKEWDYVIKKNGMHYKVGGNAQYIKKDRFVHHTSFLHSFKDEHMSLLKTPKKQPPYRKNRSHGTFITSLSDSISLDDMELKLESTLLKFGDVRKITKESISNYMLMNYRKTVRRIY